MPFALCLLPYAFFLVLKLKGKYNGQKLRRLVSKNTTPRTRRIIPNVPGTISVKYRTAKRIATSILITLSVVPRFFFMMNYVVKNVILHISLNF
jgi:hypothetical protein